MNSSFSKRVRHFFSTFLTVSIAICFSLQKLVMKKRLARCGWSDAYSEPISFPTFTFSPRIKNPHGEKLVNVDLMAIPNPSSNEIKILNLIEGESFQVETVTGKILYNIYSSSSEFLLDISKLKPRIYFVHTCNGRSLKFIKISQ